MDTNQTPAPAAEPAQPAAAPMPPVTPVPEKSDSKMVIFMIVGVVVILLIVGGIYLFLSSRQVAQPTTVTSTDTTSTDILLKDANAENVASPDSDFKPVDSDLGSL